MFREQDEHGPRYLLSLLGPSWCLQRSSEDGKNSYSVYQATHGQETSRGHSEGGEGGVAG